MSVIESIAQAHESGFFNPYWGKPEYSFLDENLGLDQESNRTLKISSEQKRNYSAYQLSKIWLRLKEWDLLTSAARTDRVARLAASWDASEYELRLIAKEIGDAEFQRKHPGFRAGDQSEAPLSVEAVLGCWAEEDSQ